jgi:hypothetical protein
VIKQRSRAVIAVFISTIFSCATHAYINGPKIHADAESIITALNKQTKIGYRDVIRNDAILENVRLIVEQAPEFPELVVPFGELLNLLYEIAKNSTKGISKNDALHMHTALSLFHLRILSPARSKSDTTMLVSEYAEKQTTPDQEEAAKLKTRALITMLDDVCDDLLVMTQPERIKPITMKDFVAEYKITATCVIASGIALFGGLSVVLYRGYDSKKIKEELAFMISQSGKPCLYLGDTKFKKVFPSTLQNPFVNAAIINKENYRVDIKKLLDHFEKEWAIRGESRSILTSLREQIREIEKQNGQNHGIQSYFSPSLQAPVGDDLNGNSKKP